MVGRPGPAEVWNTRYSDADGYLFGEEPNDFLVASSSSIRLGGDVLCIGDGEGRNGVYLASIGLAVTSVDISSVALAKARNLADRRGVELQTIEANLKTFDPGQHRWDAVVSIFVHLPHSVRSPLHRRLVGSLKPGGELILEAYHPEQAGRDTGGPSSPSFLADLDTLVAEFEGLRVEMRRHLERPVVEGSAHSGAASVVQLLAQKPEL